MKPALDPIEAYLQTGKPKAYGAATAALEVLSIAELVAFSAAFARRTELPANILAPPDDQRGAFTGRRDCLLIEVAARRFRDARTKQTDAALIALFTPAIDEDPARVVLYGASRGELAAHVALGCRRLDGELVPLASKQVLRAIAGHESPADPLFVPAVIAAQLLGDTGALDRFAALDDGSAGYIARLGKLLTFSPELSSGLITLVVKHAAATQHWLSGPLTFEGPPDLLLELLERMPGTYLDEAILKGLSRGLTAAQRARLAAFLAVAAPRTFSVKLAKLAARSVRARAATPRASRRAARPARRVRSPRRGVRR